MMTELTVLHYKNYALPDHGPHIRKCTECGVRLWIASDGIWTEDSETWHTPPEGYVRCIDQGKTHD
jgi:hypothetical protein